ncbi:MAG: hypothetical protein K2U26_10675 [Cyclobacteriaceae bacterium]|nr:hypothetical protein [Cyclobacteriaceae bacterium]
MLRLLFFGLILCFSAQSVWAQDKEVEKAKTAVSRQDSTLKAEQQKIKSWETKANRKLDSIQALGNIQHFKDSIKILTWADSLKQKINSGFSAQTGAVNRKIDSLKNLKLPTTGVQRKADSLLRKKDQLIGEVNGKQQELQQKVTGRYKKWESGVRSTVKLDSIGVGQSGIGNKIPGANLSDPSSQLSIPGMPAEAKAKAGMPSLNQKDFTSLGLSPDLAKAGGNLSIPSVDQLGSWDKQLSDITKPLDQVNGQVKQYSSALKDPSKAAEGAVGQLGDVKGLNKEITDADKLMKENQAMQLAEAMKNPEAMKEEAKEQAMKQAVDHFAGKEDILRGAMDQMAKYKKKYESLDDLSKVKKELWMPINTLRGKPFRERIHFGLHAGLRVTKDTIVVDFFPNVGYYITGRWEAGVGAIYRVKEVRKDWSFDQRYPVWGLAGFTSFKLIKSTRIRIEADVVNDPTFQKGVDEPIGRQWRWVWLAGIQNNFKISKTVTGNVQMLYNFDRKVKDGFPERLVLRFGVQYRLPQKKVK